MSQLPRVVFFLFAAIALFVPMLTHQSQASESKSFPVFPLRAGTYNLQAFELRYTSWCKLKSGGVVHHFYYQIKTRDGEHHIGREFLVSEWPDVTILKIKFAAEAQKFYILNDSVWTSVPEAKGQQDITKKGVVNKKACSGIQPIKSEQNLQYEAALPPIMGGFLFYLTYTSKHHS